MNIRIKPVILFGCCFAVAGAALANTVYVSDVYGNDETGTGSETNPMKTIQAGVDKLNDWGSTLWISNGVYKLDAPIRFADKDGQNYCIVRSTSGNPADVIIDGQNKVRCIECAGYNTQFRSITVQNGYATTSGAGLRLPRQGFVVSNCVVRNCHVVATENAEGGGIFSRSITALMDTSFFDCSVESTQHAYGGGFMHGHTYNENIATMKLSNVVLSNCVARSTTDAKGGGAYFSRANVDGLTVVECQALNINILKSVFL